jgi:hypothetical protein
MNEIGQDRIDRRIRIGCDSPDFTWHKVRYRSFHVIPCSTMAVRPQFTPRYLAAAPLLLMRENGSLIRPRSTRSVPAKAAVIVPRHTLPKTADAGLVVKGMSRMSSALFSAASVSLQCTGPVPPIRRVIPGSLGGGLFKAENAENRPRRRNGDA